MVQNIKRNCILCEPNRLITRLDVEILHYIVSVLQVLSFEPKQHFHFRIFAFSVLILSLNHSFKIWCFINE